VASTPIARRGHRLELVGPEVEGDEDIAQLCDSPGQVSFEAVRHCLWLVMASTARP
jgi:hypothetical protein